MTDTTLNRRQFIRRGTEAGLGLAAAAALAACGADTATTTTAAGTGSSAGSAATTPGSTAAGGSGALSLRYLSQENDPATVDIFQRMFEQFESGTSAATVEGEFLASGEALQRLTTLMGAGEPPNVVNLDAGEVAELATQGLLAPVTDLIESLGGVPDSARMIVEGEDYFVPAELNFWMYHYRRDMLEEAGISEAPATYPDYVAMAEALTGNGRYGNLVITNPESGFTQDTMVCYAWTSGADIFGWNGSSWDVVIGEGDNPALVANALSFLRDRAQYSPESTNYDFADANQLMATGDLAAVEYGGARTLVYLRDEAPDILDLTMTAPLPVDVRPARRYGVGGFAIFDTNPNEVEASKELARNMVTGDPYLDFLWAAPGHSVPPSRDLFEGRWREHEFISGRTDLLETIADSYETQYSALSGPSGGDATLPNLVGGAAIRSGIYGELVADALVREMDPLEAVAKAADALETLKSEVEG